MDLPFKAEYAKSGRSSCRNCKSKIEQGTLRMAAMVQSAFYDGKQPNWYHYTCFFVKQRPKSVDDIENFQKLRLPDQNSIKDHIGQGGSAAAVLPDQKKGKKRDATTAAAKKAALKDFVIEYAKSNRSTCRGCEQKIMKGEVRAAKTDFTSENAMRFGGEKLWHHLTCFAQVRSELGYFESADKLPGFKSLSKEDRAEAEKQLPAVKQEDIPPEAKKPKVEDEVDAAKKKEEEKEYEKQNKIFYGHRDKLSKNLSKRQLSDLLECNDLEIPVGQEEILDLLADVMTFGVTTPCSVCKQGQLRFNGYTYACHGHLTEWTRCTATSDEPKRTPFTIPAEFKDEFSFLKKYKYVPRTRVILNKDKRVKAENGVKKEEAESDEPKVKRALPPLYEMTFVILGQPERGKDQLKKQIIKLGGKVVTKIDKNVMAVIASQADVDKMSARIAAAQDEDVHVVPENFVDEAKDYTGKIPELVVKKSICDWGSDPNTRLPPEPSKSGSGLKSKSKSAFVKSGSGKLKLKLKGGLSVDPDSGLDHRAHVYVDGSDKYTVVLGVTDIQRNRNSYYKMQILESDHGSGYWLFRSWGRIGTTIGGNKTESMSTLYDAKREFKRLYEEKSGNMWEERHNFQKMPGLMYPIDVDYDGGDEKSRVDMTITDEPSKLPLPVQNLMRMIFDVKSMEKVMMEFELDTEKMPLGKLSKQQIKQAFDVLAELDKMIIRKEKEHVRFVDASNRFYTLVPHSFGTSEPVVLKDEEIVKQKLNMLESLLELEIAYSLMKSSGSKHDVDSYYNKLNTDIEPLDKDSEEYKLISEYLKNTHAETHRSYELVIEDLFVVKRHGEDKRYKPFKKLHNRKLLWHGSRTTNYPGILSQGLRIAPPEAPVTGYMFGKGIYFADMVSKSANYCCTNPSSPKGLLLLCEVALGEMYERERADYIEKLPKGKHSTKGVGSTQPDPNQSKVVDGVEIPLGKPVMNKNLHSSLLYNEYIVYDVGQANLKYLVKCDFKYKY